MLNRKPKATRPASYYSRLTGLSTKTIKRKLREAGLKEIRYSTAPTATVFFYQQEADKFFAQTQETK
jgi:hypothetical protein